MQHPEQPHPQLGNILSYLEEKLHLDGKNLQITPFRGGYSNLTFLISGSQEELVLRRPPMGLKIKKGHDMIREFKVLKALEAAGYSKLPRPILACDDESVMDAPFFLMEKVNGVVLRNQLPSVTNLDSVFFKKLSIETIDGLLELHKLELEKSGLLQLGKPEGYVKRQVEGWSERYLNSQTDEIKEMLELIDWLKSHQPTESRTAFIHNDYKYDNLVLKSWEDPSIVAVLDWEMATVGDPSMDLGTSLAYWAEEGDADILKMFNLTHVPGNLSRNEVLEYYAKHSGFDLKNMDFYYAFGLFKVGVIAQQIYKRYTLGFASDPRFAGLIHVVRAAGSQAMKSIRLQKI